MYNTVTSRIKGHLLQDKSDGKIKSTSSRGKGEVLEVRLSDRREVKEMGVFSSTRVMPDEGPPERDQKKCKNGVYPGHKPRHSVTRPGNYFDYWVNE